MKSAYKLKSPYFPRDLDARSNKKLRKLRRELGREADSIYWDIIADLHKEQGWLELSDIENLSYELQVDEELLTKIVKGYDLFRIEGDKYTSDRVLKNLQHIEEKSEQARNAINERWRREKRATDVIRH